VNGLVVSTAVWVVNRIHCNTADVREQLTTGLGLVVSSTCSSQRHFISSVTSEHTNSGSAVSREFSEASRWHADTHFLSNSSLDKAGVSCCTSDLASVPRTKFEVVDCSSFWNVSE
jgi:hypothetical protein